MPDALQADSLEAALTVVHLDHSVTWYCDALGFVIDRRHERDGRLFAVSLRAGAVRVLLSQDDGAKGPGRVKGDGISLQLTTAQEAAALAARITTQGTALDTEPTRTPWGVTVFRVRDPDGFRWTISSTHAV